MKKRVTRKTQLGLVLTGCLLASSLSQASVIVSFSEDAGRVTIEMAGTITIDSSYSSSSSAAVNPGLADGNTWLIISGDDGGSRIKYSDAGVATTTTFELTGNYYSADYGDTTGGFFKESFYAVGPGVVHVGTRTYDFTGVKCSMGTTLANMGAENFDNQLAWTANNTGDTITYQTIPEPSVIGLAGVFSAGLLGVRRIFMI